MKYTMKLLLIIFLLLKATTSSAQSYQSPFTQLPTSTVTTSSPTASVLPSQCKWADSVVIIEFSDWSIFPTSSYVKEGDRVCLIAQARGEMGSVFSLQNYPVGGSIQKNGERVFSFVARKVGTYNITCTGTCKESKATFNVLSKAEYQKMEDNNNKYNSLNNRPKHLGN